MDASAIQHAAASRLFIRGADFHACLGFCGVWDALRSERDRHECPADTFTGWLGRRLPPKAAALGVCELAGLVS